MMTATKLTAGKTYDVDSLVCVGWSNGEATYGGLSHTEYFRDGVYMGADNEGVEPLYEMAEQIIIQADQENNAEEFWAELDTAFPKVAQQLRESGQVTVDQATWDAIQNLSGFSDGPSYARNALLVVE